jgi:purine-cytosine permease-like protein
MPAMTATQPRPGGLEVRSIDYVPLSERHGKVWHLGPLWFMSNAQIATLAVGLISISDAELDRVGDHVFTGFGAVVLILATLGLVSVTALNMYGGSLTLISAIDSFRKIRPTLGLRVVTIGLTALLSLIGALAATKNFLGNFNNFLLLILYLFIPWTAVNLVDFYIVRRGHYAIAEIFNPRGLYGRWGGGASSPT